MNGRVASRHATVRFFFTLYSAQDTSASDDTCMRDANHSRPLNGEPAVLTNKVLRPPRACPSLASG